MNTNGDNIGKEFTYDEIPLGEFPSEKAIEQYLYENIDIFMDSVFGESIKEATLQYSKPSGHFQISDKTEQIMLKRGPRVDMYIECESGHKFLIEIKNPKSNENYSSLSAIGQLLFYTVNFPEADRYVIISTKYDKGFIEVVKKYNLPVDFVLFAKKSCYLLKI